MSNSPSRLTELTEGIPMSTSNLERITLAGGCFWCLEAVYERVRGVHRVENGYSNGQHPNPNYEQVCSGNTGHAEVVRIDFDPAEVSLRELLEIFFAIHDPTTLNRQGNDIGMSYRSAIFYTSQAQKETALETIADVDASGLWPGTVVTEVAPAGPFWEAEPEHQDYLERIPNGYTCHFIRPDWKLPTRAERAAAG